MVAILAHLSWMRPPRVHERHEMGGDSLNDKKVLRQVWIIFESLRNSLDQLLKILPSWITARTTFADYGGECNLRSLYTLLGLPPKWSEFVADLQLRWEDGRLCVAAKCRFDADLPQKLNFFTYLFNFEDSSRIGLRRW